MVFEHQAALQMLVLHASTAASIAAINTKAVII